MEDIIMPNWCSNTLTVLGKRKELVLFDIDRMKRMELNKEPTVEGEPITLELQLAWYSPIPEGYCTLDDFSNDKWYMWCIENWGTKWDLGADDVLMKRENQYKLVFSFETAWSPPVEGVQAISKLFPQLWFTLEYQEDGVCFKGFSDFQNGEIVNEFTTRQYRCDYHFEWEEDDEGGDDAVEEII
jgi:hypothetical protein